MPSLLNFAFLLFVHFLITLVLKLQYYKCSSRSTCPQGALNWNKSVIHSVVVLIIDETKVKIKDSPFCPGPNRTHSGTPCGPSLTAIVLVDRKVFWYTVFQICCGNFEHQLSKCSQCTNYLQPVNTFYCASLYVKHEQELDLAARSCMVTFRREHPLPPASAGGKPFAVCNGAWWGDNGLHTLG